jgi:filamentous hemagglutinin
LPPGCTSDPEACDPDPTIQVDSWEQAEDWLNEKFGGEKQVPFDVDGEIRWVDNLTPEDVAQEAKFGQQGLNEFVEQEIQKDLDLWGNQQVSGVQWWFFTSSEAGGPSGPLLQYLYNQGIEVFLDGVPWSPPGVL